VSTDDRRKLDAHLGAVHDLEARLATLAVAGAGCGKPVLGAAFDVSKQVKYPATVKLQIDLLVMALACDLTRVATLQCGDSVHDMYFTWLGITETWHHNLTHAKDGDTASWEKVARIHHWYVEQFAYLLGKLRDVREGAGTLLDSALVFHTSELSKGNAHTDQSMPFVLAGRAGGALRTGRYLDYQPANRIFHNDHNDLLVSFQNAFDIPATTFGHAPWCTGPLALLL
jgi:hypothetical protein